MNPKEFNELIRKRRAVFPNSYIGKEISEEVLRQILENANWAPTHKRTEPWRFKVMRGKALERLSEFLADSYKSNVSEESFSEIKYRKTREKPLQSACVIAICMRKSGEVPEWEEIAAVASAVQNMWLTCSSLGIGSYWSTPKAALEADEFLGLPQDERCLGLFYMGYFDVELPEGKRTPIEEKITWLNN